MTYWVTVNGHMLHQGMTATEVDSFARECIELGAIVSVSTR